MSCRHDLDADLERQTALVERELADAREALRYELPLAERMALTEEEFELLRLLRRIEERRFDLADR